MTINEAYATWGIKPGDEVNVEATKNVLKITEWEIENCFFGTGTEQDQAEALRIIIAEEEKKHA